MKKEHIFKFLTNRLTRNVIFWALIILLEYPFVDNSLVDMVCLILFGGVAGYIHNAVLIPNFLLKRRYILYLLTFAGLIAVIRLGAFINISNVHYTDGKKINVNTYTAIYLFIVAILAMGQFISDAIKFKLENEELKSKQIQSELQILKSQINPHFLFNALNTIYGMALRNETETAATVMSLSNILRHTLYESEHPKITIDEEINFLKEYIAFAQLRTVNKDRIAVTIANNTTQTQFIAPLLLIPFVENAIKHGLGSDAHTSWIEINLSIFQGALHFICENNICKRDTEAGEFINTGGIGLSNVRRRLQLLYKDQHTLLIDNSHNHFKVSLTIMLI